MNELTTDPTNCANPATIFACRRRFRLATSLGLAVLAVSVLLLLSPVPSQAQAPLGLQQTVGTASNICAPTAAIAVAANTIVHFCVTLTNPTNVMLTQHNIMLVSPQIGLSRNFTFSTNLPAGENLVVNTAYLASIGQPTQLSAIAGTNFTSTVTVTSTNDSDTTASGTATARVAIGSVGMTIAKTVNNTRTGCANSGLAVNAGTTVYYCITIVKSGTLPLVTHRLIDPALGIDVPLDAPITDNQPVVITADQVPALNKTITENFTNTATLTSYTAEGIAVTAQAAAHVVLGSAAIVVTDTLGTTANECSNVTTLTVATGSNVYHCIRIKNQGTIPLRYHRINIPLFGLNKIVTQTLQAGAVLTVTSNTLPELRRTISTQEASTANVTSTSVNRVVAQDTATTQVNVGTATLTVIKYPQRAPNTCNKDTALNVVSNEQFYYCLVVRNNGQLPLVSHNFSEPGFQLTGSFSYTLGAGQILTLTNQFFANNLQVNSTLGPFRTAVNLNHTLTYIARTTTNTAVNAPATAPVNIVLPTPTRTTAPTAIPTFTPTITPIPTETPTPIPTPTPTNVVLSLPATPTSPFNLNSIESPTPGIPGAAQNLGFDSPVATPFAPTPAFIDFAATTVALTVEADATATSLALFSTSPLPTATETPTPTPIPLLPTATLPTENPTPTVLAVIIATPTLLPPMGTPAPIADYLNLMAGVLAVSTATLGWIWFLVGSIIFFAVAGIFAGLTFRQQERHRYDTATREEDDFPLLDEPAEAALSSAGSLYYITDAATDGYTVATSNARSPQVPADRPRNQPPTQDLESDDFWPASLR